MRSQALLSKHGAALERNFYRNYASAILRRIVCPGLHDSLARGIRGGMRKLLPWERLVTGVRTIAGQGLTPRIYATGVAAAIVTAQGAGETELSCHDVLAQHCGLRPGDEGDLIDLVRERREWLEREFCT